MLEQSISRRLFLGTSAAGAVASLAGRSQGAPPAPSRVPELVWHDVQEWGVEGKGWNETARFYDRLPARAEGIVPPAVWNLSRHSAGMVVHFRTDAELIWTDHVVTSSSLALANLSAIATSGLDLYTRNATGDWTWLSVTRPSSREMRGTLVSGLPVGERDYQLYLPLYNGTESLKIGVPPGRTFTPVAPRNQKPILFYGTSITHGASASRAGMPHPAILGRRLNRPVLNLGFSGNGKMEKEVGMFLCELDPAVYVIDCLPNMMGPQVEERAAPLVRQLRAARPKTPVVLVEDRTYPNAEFFPAKRSRQEASRKALRAAFDTLKKEGVTGLWYLEGEHLLGADRDDTADGSHPSDLGFWRQANAFEPVLKEALAASQENSAG